ncbi:MAG: polyphosphate kinase 2 family protein [Puniceicoccaceae bacterium]
MSQQASFDSDTFLVNGHGRFRIAKHPTKIGDLYTSKSDYKHQLGDLQDEINDLQRMMYAHGRYSMLLIFQAMDAAGKDGTIRAVMAGVNAHGVTVHAFTRPSRNELEHDFLWRTTLRLPNRGHIGIFNRSYYEEVLVARVHPSILENQNLPKELLADKDRLWKQRFESINDFEKHMDRNGTRVVKFFLHLGYDEQRERFLQRIDKPHKNWKFEDGDIRERRHWGEFQSAYEEAVNATAKPHAPWYVVPADDKKNMRLIVARIILEQLRSIDMCYPEVTEERRAELKKDRRLLEND